MGTREKQVSPVKGSIATGGNRCPVDGCARAKLTIHVVCSCCWSRLPSELRGQWLEVKQRTLRDSVAWRACVDRMLRALGPAQSRLAL